MSKIPEPTRYPSPPSGGAVAQREEKLIEGKYEALMFAIRVVIESCFSQSKEEIQDRAVKIIGGLIENEYGTF